MNQNYNNYNQNNDINTNNQVNNSLNQNYYQQPVNQSINEQPVYNQNNNINNEPNNPKKKSFLPIILLIVIIIAIVGIIVVVKPFDKKDNNSNNNENGTKQQTNNQTTSPEKDNKKDIYNKHVFLKMKTDSTKKESIITGIYDYSVPLTYNEIINKYPELYVKSKYDKDDYKTHKDTVEKNEEAYFCLSTYKDCYVKIGFVNKDAGKRVEDLMNNNRFYYIIGNNGIKRVLNIDLAEMDYVNVTYDEEMDSIIKTFGNPNEIYVKDYDDGDFSKFFMIYKYDGYMIAFEFSEVVYNYEGRNKIDFNELYYLAGNDFTIYGDDLLDLRGEEFDLIIK